MGDTVEFTVEVEDYPDTPGARKKWLSAERRWTHDKNEALLIKMRRRPKMRDLSVIESRCHELSGGFRTWINVSSAERDVWTERLNVYVAQLWPDGRPKVQSAAEEEQQQQALTAAYLADDSDRARGLRELRETVSRVRFLASWPVLVVDPPPGWASIEDFPDDPPGLLQMLIAAYADAVALAEETEGN